MVVNMFLCAESVLVMVNGVSMVNVHGLLILTVAVLMLVWVACLGL
ncbi:hypothetical protein HanIR_Chr16g0811811 [Helianthus annuus]|nr:hypothetical protein HanIR_Chr16g0811811 [Helianthus annuus]